MKHVPAMSRTATNYISNYLQKELRSGDENHQYIVEYGSGASTHYFIGILSRHSLRPNYYCVERSIQWFDFFVSQTNAQLISQKQWGLWRYLRFIFLPHPPPYGLPSECRRLPKQKWRMLLALPKYIISQRRKRAFGELVFGARQNEIELKIFYSYEGFKDQFGESPNKEIYIKTPLMPIEDALKSGAHIELISIVDGGPRRDIVKYLLELSNTYINLKLDLFLLEAGRGWYADLINRYTEGKFVAADLNEKVDGSIYLVESTVRSKCDNFSGSGSLQRALQTELWHYTNRTSTT